MSLRTSPVWLAISLLLVLTCCMGTRASNAADPVRSRTLRVAVASLNHFCEDVTKGSRTEYGMELLRLYSEHSGWDFELILDTFEGCLRRLNNGEVDVMLPGVDSAALRISDVVLGEEALGVMHVALYVLPQQAEQIYSEIASPKVLRVGMVYNDEYEALFDRFVQVIHVDAEKVFYQSQKELSAALDVGDVDVVLSSMLGARPEWQVFSRVGLLPMHFVAKPENKNILRALDTDLRIQALRNPGYSFRTYQAGCTFEEPLASTLTNVESTFIKSAPVLRVLADAEGFPLEWYNPKTQQFEGVYPDILQMIAQKTGLRFEFVPLNAERNTWERLKAGEGDILLSAANLPGLHAKYNVRFTSSYFMETLTTVVKRGRHVPLEGEPVAVVPEATAGVRNLFKTAFPTWKYITAPNIETCLQMVLDDKADMAILSSVVLQAGNYMQMAPELTVLFMDMPPIPVVFGLHADVLPVVQSILDKGIAQLDENKVQQTVIRNTLEVGPELSYWWLLRKYLTEILFFMAAFAVLAMFMLMLIGKRRLEQRQYATLEEKNRQLNQVISQREELKRLAEHDALTGLYNKVSFRILAEEKLQGGEGVSLFLIDLDNFKAINDVLGHAEGDAVLRDVANVLSNMFRVGDIVGRFGGDEFYAITRHAPSSALHSKIKTLCDALQRTYGNEVYGFVKISASIGIACAMPATTNFTELFANADKALYQAKSKGKNCGVVYGELEEPAA